MSSKEEPETKSISLWEDVAMLRSSIFECCLALFSFYKIIFSSISSLVYFRFYFIKKKKRTMSTQKSTGRDEDLLLQDFSRNVTTKSWALFIGNAAVVSAIPLCKLIE